MLNNKSDGLFLNVLLRILRKKALCIYLDIFVAYGLIANTDQITLPDRISGAVLSCMSSAHKWTSSELLPVCKLLPF